MDPEVQMVATGIFQILCEHGAARGMGTEAPRTDVGTVVTTKHSVDRSILL